MKRAFTLVELIVVVGIIGILSSILIASLSGGSDSARAALCLSNMKNLATAAQTYAMENKYYPLAGNMVYVNIRRDGQRNVRREYNEVPGWISLDSQGKYPTESYTGSSTIGLYSSEDEKARFALTNGVLWKYVSANRETYLCPEHAKRIRKTDKSLKPNWSYLMNAYFSWNFKDHAYNGDHGRKRYGELPTADKLLLFSEVPFSGYNSWQPSGEGGSTDTDAILQFSTSGLKQSDNVGGIGQSGNEEIGVNHVHKRQAYAHVAFADGHTEKLRVPMKGKEPDTSQMKELTTWLCAGKDVSFSAGQYKKIDE